MLKKHDARGAVLHEGGLHGGSEVFSAVAGLGPAGVVVAKDAAGAVVDDGDELEAPNDDLVFFPTGIPRALEGNAYAEVDCAIVNGPSLPWPPEAFFASYFIDGKHE